MNRRNGKCDDNDANDDFDNDDNSDDDDEKTKQKCSNHT